jgi:serine protease Do
MKRLFLILGLGIIGCEAAPVDRTPEVSGAKAGDASRIPSDLPAQAPVILIPSTFADIVERTRPAVVNIYTRKRVTSVKKMVGVEHRLVPQERLEQSLGSGFIIGSDGMVITNYHVVADATEIEVRLFDERWFKAQIVGDDAKTDIALLKLDGAVDLPALALGDSSALRVGDWVLAIGNPLGLTSTVTAGIASATGRKKIPLGGDLQFQDFIQTDASINPGNSGGPLMNLDGTVIGINTATAFGQGIGFAIPANMVKEILPSLSAGGHLQRSWLGIYVDEVPKALRPQIGLPATGGALVTGVVRGGPAEKAAIKPGDVILALDGNQVSDSSKLAWLAGNVGVGMVARLEIQRGNQALELTIEMGALPD